MSAALVLVAGLLTYALVDHLLRVRRARRFALPDAHTHETHDTPEPYESEARMSMSKQQLNTLGLARVRKAVASGKAKSSDIERWKKELGADAVQKIVDAAASKDASASAPAPASREQKKATTSAKE